MQPDTIRTLAEYIYELQRRDRDHYPAREHPTVNTTVEDDNNRSERHRSGNDGRSENTTG
jgi:hypothetical protein